MTKKILVRSAYWESFPLSSRTGNLTKMVVQGSSWYSISASARAVWSWGTVNRLHTLVDEALFGHLAKDLDLLGLKFGAAG